MVPNGWNKAELGKYIVEHRKKSTTQDEYDVFTSSRKGLVLQSEYFSGSRLATRDNIGYNILPDNHITYRSRSDDGIFVFNINNTGSAGIISHFYPVFKIKNGDIGFFLELLNFYKRKIGSFSVGTSQTVLSMNALKKVKLNVPPLPEQKKIAQILSTWDKAIEAVDKLIENSQKQKKWLMQNLLTGKKRLPGFSGEWKDASLEDLVYRPIAYGVLMPGENIEGGVPLVKIQDIVNNSIEINRLHKISRELHEEYKRTELRCDDLIISIVGTLGRVFQIGEELDGANISRAFAVIGVDHKRALPGFIFHCLASDATQSWMVLSSAGNAQKVVNLNVIKKMSISIPAIDEQLAISMVLDAAMLHCDKLVDTKNVLEKQKIALMQQLLTGKRRVKFDETHSPALAG